VTSGLGVLTLITAVWLVDWRGDKRSVDVGIGAQSMALRGTF
jgi:hypothetical protein